MEIRPIAYHALLSITTKETAAKAIWSDQLRTVRDQHCLKFANFLEKIDEIPTNFSQVSKMAAAIYTSDKNSYLCKRFKKCRKWSRYPDICTFDWSMVDHRKTIGDERFFLHANRVSVNGKHYISSQGPNSKMINSFLQTLIIEDVEAIVSLVMPIEGGKVKCENYWTPGIPYSINILDKTFEIIFSEQETLFFSDDGTQSINKSIMTITCDGELWGEKQHFHYANWPDHGIPDNNLFKELVLLLQDYGSDSNHPLLCHCSAGVGRTGTFQAVHSLASKPSEENDLPKTILKMRLQRLFLVTTQSQFDFASSMVDEIKHSTGY